MTWRGRLDWFEAPHLPQLSTTERNEPVTLHRDSEDNVRFLPFVQRPDGATTNGKDERTGTHELEEPTESEPPSVVHNELVAGVMKNVDGDLKAPAILVKNTLASLVAAFTGLDSWKGVLAWNEFNNRIMFRREAPFKDISRFGDTLRDEDIARMRLGFETEFGEKVSKANILDAVRIVAWQNRFHPLQEYVSSLQWDGVSRVDTWLEDFCAVRPSSPEHQRLIRAVSRKWLVSCVARALQPGCKVDCMLILEGKQGIGKSTALAALAGENFFCDSLIDFGGKDACQTIQGVWIYELSEMTAILRSDSSSAKAFLTRPTDKFRAPYARAPMTVPRSVVFCGTINHGGYLKDHSGNRRFWMVRCEDDINVEGIRAVRDQLWAEARVLFDNGESWHLSPEEEALMKEQHEDRLEIEPWDELISKWVTQHGDQPFAVDHVLEGALGIRAASRNPNVTQRVHHILERLGFERKRRSFEKGGGRVYRYVRCFTAPVPYCEPVDLEACESELDP